MDDIKKASSRFNLVVEKHVDKLIHLAINLVNGKETAVSYLSEIIATISNDFKTLLINDGVSKGKAEELLQVGAISLAAKILKDLSEE